MISYKFFPFSVLPHVIISTLYCLCWWRYYKHKKDAR